jgi:hypothetical protein
VLVAYVSCCLLFCCIYLLHVVSWDCRIERGTNVLLACMAVGHVLAKIFVGVVVGCRGVGVEVLIVS